MFLFVSSVFAADTVLADEVVAAEETLATTTKAIENSLRDFELSGIGLSEDKQQRYGENCGALIRIKLTI